MEHPFQSIINDYLQVFRSKNYRLNSNPNLGSLTIEESYQIQQAIINERLKNGEEIAGYKVGCTSKAIQQQFGLTNPIKGFVTRPFIYDNHIGLDAGYYENLAIEPEFVIRIGKDVTSEFLEHYAIEDAIDSIAAGIELHNYKFCFKPTSQELIILNGIHAGLVIGEEKQYRKGADLNLEGVGVFVNGDLTASAIGAEIMSEGPIKSLHWLASQLLSEGKFLKAGEIVIPGSPVGLILLKAGDHVKVTITNWGSAEATIS